MEFIDLKAQQKRIRPELDAAIARVLDHGRYIMGPEIDELEAALAEFAGSRHCLSCSSGTDALLLPLLAYELGPGDAVFTSPFTFFASPESIALTGATPVFIDIDPASYNMNPALLEAAIEKVERETDLRPRGIMPVDIFGLPADYDALVAIAERFDLFVIGDAAQSFGAEYMGRRSPALGHVGATSFFPAKPLGCYGDGGAVFTDDDQLADAMRSLRVHGQGGDKYDNVRIGLNARMDTIQAAVLIEKLKIYPDEIDARQRVARMYIDAFNALGEGGPISKLPEVPPNYKSVFAQFCVESPQRSDVQERLAAAGIPSPIYYARPMHKLAAMQDKCLTASDGGLPVAEAAAESIFALPFHPYLTKEQINTIASVIKG